MTIRRLEAELQQTQAEAARWKALCRFAAGFIAPLQGDLARAWMADYDQARRGEE